MEPPVGAAYSLAVAWDFSVRATDTLNSLVATAAHSSIAVSECASPTIVEPTHTCTERPYNTESRYGAENYYGSEHCCNGDNNYNGERCDNPVGRYSAEDSYSAYPVSVDCGKADGEYCITRTEWKWADRVRRDYNVDILDRLSDSQLETLYSAYHALRDWHSGLPLDDDQHMALLRVCLIADKHRSRGELATPTTLLTSMAFRHMDKYDVLYTIPRLVVEYYSEH
ncbi:hypothetical protein GGH94_001668 [Coemansia aciculifera]|uniref:Uncharacterized protein n=1 Tax=Coemansia aciculifera TaxID=417176 RepID=A0A9W8M679_9FUNG|nr:hypothetical protein GGH94_001668 [Coemansia aciculifera]KAJ2870299.1 hypothetical protein GGH93_005672 [Coemansia aciculifera]